MNLLGFSLEFGSNSRGIILFGIEIYYYGICIVCGMVLAAVLSALLMKRRNISPENIYILFLVCIPTAIICARLYYCITDTTTSIADFIHFRDGGLSVIGGVIGGVAAGYLVCRIKKVEFLRMADCIVVNILFAQAMGRWGNYFNQEVYGALVTNPALQVFPLAVQIVSQWHYALFFYEMCINLVGWALLFTFSWFYKKKPNGIGTCLYFVWYGLVRMFMEPLRDSKFVLSGSGVPWSFLTSILMWGLGVIAVLCLLLWNRRKEGAFFGSAKGDGCGLTEYVKCYKDDRPYYSKINMFGKNYPPKPEKKDKKGGGKDSDSEDTQGDSK